MVTFVESVSGDYDEINNNQIKMETIVPIKQFIIKLKVIMYYDIFITNITHYQE